MYDLFIVITISSQGTPLQKDFIFSACYSHLYMYVIFYCFEHMISMIIII